VLAAPDYVASLLLPGLLELLAKEAPSVDLDVRPIDPRTLLHQLESGDIDLVIAGAYLASPSLVRRSVLRESFACVVRRGHPAARGAFTLERYLELPHALVSLQPGASGLVDRVLEARGLKRRVALRIPYLLLASGFIAKTDLVLTVPRHFAEQMATTQPVVVLEPPLELPQTEILITWHVRLGDDPAHRWFREAVARISHRITASRS
jgi:DNA-binding transcriptional LysR family regulator